MTRSGVAGMAALSDRFVVESPRKSFDPAKGEKNGPKFICPHRSKG